MAWSRVGSARVFPPTAPPPTSNNPVKLSPAWINLFPQTNGRLFRRHVGIFRVCVRSHSSSLGFFCQWLLPLPRRHAPFSSGSPITPIPAPQGYPTTLGRALGTFPELTTDENPT